MIQIDDKSHVNCMTIGEAVAMNATSIKMDGHFYIIIYKVESKNAKLLVDDDCIPLLNIKSRSIRAISTDVLVEIVDFSVSVTKSKNGV